MRAEPHFQTLPMFALSTAIDAIMLAIIVAAIGTVCLVLADDRSFNKFISWWPLSSITKPACPDCSAPRTGAARNSFATVQN
jgi:hypothetical protein